MTIIEAPIKGQTAQSPTPGPGNLPIKRKITYCLLAALVVAVVVAVPVTVTQFTVHRRSTRGTSQVSSSSSSSSVLSHDYCDKLSAASKDYCNAYLKSKGPSKFMAASIWLQVSQATRKLHHGCIMVPGMLIHADVVTADMHAAHKTCLAICSLAVYGGPTSAWLGQHCFVILCALASRRASPKGHVLSTHTSLTHHSCKPVLMLSVLCPVLQMCVPA
jgi:hypothetical protein